MLLLLAAEPNAAPAAHAGAVPPQVAAATRQASAPALPADAQARVDALFAAFETTESPGCAVGIALDGVPALRRAYGMADLEQERPNTVDTVFEAGSVSKQFTAAAVLLLAQDGRLSLDDPVRKHFPELPDYGAPLTIRHLVHHTSGLRDWGAVVGIAGWPRGSRAVTQAHVLDVISRQRALNYAPGERYSYTNSGYNLLAMLVARVSGQGFAEFTRKRIFEPLGMSRSGWRDDFRRVVKERATAYSRRADGWQLDMPFESAHGPGGLLTTVSDLLAWNENFVSGRVGGTALVNAQLREGVLAGGASVGYAAGVSVDSWRGTRVVSHSGATAGYRANLARFADQRLSLAVLCNASGAEARELSNQVAAIVLGDRLAPVDPVGAAALTPAAAAERAGLYVSELTHVTRRLVVLDGRLMVEDGPQLLPTSGTAFRLGSTLGEFVLGADGSVTGLRLSAPGGLHEAWRRLAPVTPTPEELAAFVGRYRSDEAEAELVAAVEGGRLVLKQRPDSVRVLRPTYPDAFSGEGRDVRFLRDARRRVVGLSLSTSRLWDLRFERMGG